ncbi:carboxysome peptide B [Halochromatium sp.]
MEINQVVGTLYCTQRIEGLRHCSLQILKDRKGKLLVATDPVGVRPGNWVFTVSGSAGRLAMPDPKTMTDLSIGGIIDFWQPEQVAKAESSSGDQQPTEQQDQAA